MKNFKPENETGNTKSWLDQNADQIGRDQVEATLKGGDKYPAFLKAGADHVTCATDQNDASRFLSDVKESDTIYAIDRSLVDSE
jgi:hypothetical protein